MNRKLFRYIVLQGIGNVDQFLSNTLLVQAIKNISNTAQEEQIFFDRVFSRTISKRTEGSITKTTYRRAS